MSGLSDTVVLALGTTIGLLLQILACVLYNNYYLMILYGVYFLVALPLLMISAGANDPFNQNKKQLHAAYFLTAALFVAALALPLVLFHVDKIERPTLGLGLASVFFFAGFGSAYYYKKNHSSEY
eukprot:TRINITY_DN1978_c0_g1_i3.p1 TRINITY_DN1978_c0_g1~~TRINITY_DN1978_c0_g1_i3.p1  ORF type:complete len:125 (-),score=33.21 TRINITY_DN1978_c0_g1_i3:203-577(-)